MWGHEGIDTDTLSLSTLVSSLETSTILVLIPRTYSSCVGRAPCTKHRAPTRVRPYTWYFHPYTWYDDIVTTYQTTTNHPSHDTNKRAYLPGISMASNKWLYKHSVQTTTYRREHTHTYLGNMNIHLYGRNIRTGTDKYQDILCLTFAPSPHTYT